MYCDRYKCTMNENSCFIRRRNALSDSPKDKYKPGFSDKGCLTCEQGLEVAKKMDPKAAAEYSATLREIRNRAAEALTPKKEVSVPATQTIPAEITHTAAETTQPAPSIKWFECKRCKTPKERTSENFAPHYKAKDGLNTTCRECMRKAMRAGHKERQFKKAAAVKQQTPESVSISAKKSANHRNRIKRDINFYGHVDLMRAIEDEAKSQFRQFNAHVLFILTQHINQQKTGILP